MVAEPRFVAEFPPGDLSGGARPKNCAKPPARLILFISGVAEGWGTRTLREEKRV